MNSLLEYSFYKAFNATIYYSDFDKDSPVYYKENEKYNISFLSIFDVYNLMSESLKLGEDLIYKKIKECIV